MKISTASALEKARLALDEFRQEDAERILLEAIEQDRECAELYGQLALTCCFNLKELEAVDLLTNCEGASQLKTVRTILANHFYCRKLLAEKLGVEDQRGAKAWRHVEAFWTLDSTVGIKLSACLIVKNEEKNLARCLSSLKDVADEIVVVDTGSTDKTVAIAEGFGAKIGHFDWINDFAAARNESLRLATGHWALWIDADEELSLTSFKTLREALIRPHFGGYFVKIVNFMDARSEANQYVHMPVRLFRRFDGIEFSGRIHEQVLPSFQKLGLICATLGGMQLNHYGYQAAAMVEKNKVERTIGMLELEVAEDETDAFQWFNLANAYSVARRPAEAALAAQRSIDHLCNDAPYGTLSYQILASSRIAEGDAEGALEICAKARETGFNSVCVQFEEAHAWYKLRRFDEALASIDECLSMDWPDTLTGDRGIKTYKAHVLKAQILLALGKIEEANNLTDYALGIDPHFSLAIFTKGAILEAQNRSVEAYECFENCFEADGLQVGSRKLAGQIDLKFGRYAAAQKLFSEAAALKPEDGEARVFLIKCLESQELWREACQAYEEMPGGVTSEILVNWGRALDLAGEPHQALETFAQAIDHDPANANAFFNCGDLLYRQGNFAEAADLYEGGLRLLPQHAPGWFVLGNTFAQLGVLEGAKLAYQQALRINPTLLDAQKNLMLVQQAVAA